MKGFTVSAVELEHAVLHLYQDNPEGAESVIADFLKTRLDTLDPPEQTAVLDTLIQRFEASELKGESPCLTDSHILKKICEQFLGRDIALDSLEPDELLRKLADAINTVFDSLNQLISTINVTLAGNQGRDETIRQVIGYHLEDDGSGISLENHIGQIRNAFIACHEAFQTTTLKKLEQIIEELCPETIKRETGAARINPARKARCFDTYEAKFNKFITWVETGKFMESYLRDVESNCRDLSF